VRHGWLLIGIGLAGCFDPHPSPGGACGPGGACPSGLVCVADICVEPGTPLPPDATVDASAPLPDDAPVDAPPLPPPPDATVDAFVDPSLVAHWTFDDPPGDGAIDATGRGHDATCINCPAHAPGILGMGYRFDAVNDVLYVADSMDFRGDMTVALWASADNTTGQISAATKISGGGTGNTWQLELMPTDRWSFSGGTVHYLEGGPVTMPQTWHHIAGTWDGTTKRLYVDGVLVAMVVSAFAYDTSQLVLGADINTGALDLFWDGVLDDIRIYDRPLTAGEIAMLAAPPP
jgi:hypothetical protein